MMSVESRYNSINEKGARSYLTAARILSESDGENLRGPIDYCSGLAIEIALKLCLKEQDTPVAEWEQIAHNLEALSGMVQGLTLTEDQERTLRELNARYFRDGDDRHPSRYRPSGLRAGGAPGHAAVEALFEFILSHRPAPPAT